MIQDRATSNSLTPSPRRSCFTRFALPALLVLVSAGGIIRSALHKDEMALLNAPPARGQLLKKIPDVALKVADPETLPAGRLQYLREYAREFERLFYLSPLAKDEQAYAKKFGVHIELVSSHSGQVPDNKFAQLRSNGVIYVDEGKIPNGPANQAARDSWSAIMLEAAQLQLGRQIQTTLKLKFDCVLNVQESLLAAAAKTHAITIDTDNKNDDPNAGSRRLQFLQTYAPELAFMSSLVREVAIQGSHSITMHIQRSQNPFLVNSLDDYLQYLMDEDNNTELLSLMDAKTLAEVRTQFSVPDNVHRIKDTLAVTQRDALRACLMGRITAFAHQMTSEKEGSDTDKLSTFSYIMNMFYCLDVPSRNGLKQTVEPAAVAALPTLFRELSKAKDSDHRRSSILAMISTASDEDFGGRITDENRKIMRTYIEESVSHREKDRSWGGWHIQERYTLEAEDLTHLIEASYAAYSHLQHPAMLKRMMNLLKTLLEGGVQFGPELRAPTPRRERNLELMMVSSLLSAA